MSAPDYLVCVECETPCYTFELEEAKVVWAFCEACGNDDTTQFLTEDDYEELIWE